MAICSFDQYELTARLEPNARVELGAPMALSYALDKLHYFDAQTGQRLPAQ